MVLAARVLQSMLDSPMLDAPHTTASDAPHTSEASALPCPTPATRIPRLPPGLPGGARVLGAFATFPVCVVFGMTGSKVEYVQHEISLFHRVRRGAGDCAPRLPLPRQAGSCDKATLIRGKYAKQQIPL